MAEKKVELNSDEYTFPTDDPFYIVEQRIRVAIQQIRSKYNMLKESILSENEFNTTAQNLEEDKQLVSKDLKDLEDTIQIVEANRAKFSGINDQELERRTTFINATKMFLQETKISSSMSRQTDRILMMDGEIHAEPLNFINDP